MVIFFQIIRVLLITINQLYNYRILQDAERYDSIDIPPPKKNPSLFAFMNPVYLIKRVFKIVFIILIIVPIQIKYCNDHQITLDHIRSHLTFDN